MNLEFNPVLKNNVEVTFYLVLLQFFINSQAGKNVRLDKFEIPAKIKLLSQPWTSEAGLVTAALKIKREAIRKACADDLARLYE